VYSDETSPLDDHSISLCITTWASKPRGKAQSDGLVYITTIYNGLQALISEARIRHPGWSLQLRDQEIIDNHIDGLVQAKKLRTYRFEKALPSLQLQNAIVIARRTLARAVEESRSSDVVANQILILSLLVSAAARAGDLGWLTKDGPDVALQMREIELHLGYGDATLANIVLQVDINCYKGNRYAHQKS
jgi:hypothetical protein